MLVEPAVAQARGDQAKQEVCRSLADKCYEFSQKISARPSSDCLRSEHMALKGARPKPYRSCKVYKVLAFSFPRTNTHTAGHEHTHPNTQFSPPDLISVYAKGSTSNGHQQNSYQFSLKEQFKKGKLESRLAWGITFISLVTLAFTVQGVNKTVVMSV